MGAIDDRIDELGLTLPPEVVAPPGVVLPFAFVKVIGDRALISGHGPQAADGAVAEPLGRLGDDLDVEQQLSERRQWDCPRDAPPWRCWAFCSVLATLRRSVAHPQPAEHLLLASCSVARAMARSTCAVEPRPMSPPRG